MHLNLRNFFQQQKEHRVLGRYLDIFIHLGVMFKSAENEDVKIFGYFHSDWGGFQKHF